MTTDGPDLVSGMMLVSFAMFWLLFGGSPTSLTATATYYTCGEHVDNAATMPLAARRCDAP